MNIFTNRFFHLNKFIMEKNRFSLLIALLTCFTLSVSAQSEAQPYFTAPEMPDMQKFLPEPPDTTSSRFANDIMQYFWGKTQRLNAERAEIAKRDAVYGLETIINEFSEPFGLLISEEGTPEIYKVLRDGLATCDSVCRIPKEHYMRRRPFSRFNEPTLVPEQEEAHLTNGSYPSGHTILGWSAALLMTEINPEAQDTLLARGYMFGDSRIIAGYHWQSDVDAARLAASAAYAKLHTSERFLQQMAKARKEFADLKAAKVGTPVKAQTTADSHAYTVAGTPANDQTRGIVIDSGRKTVRK